MTKNLLAAANPADGGGITNPIFSDTYTGLITSVDGGEAFLTLLLPKLVGIILVFGSTAFFFMFVWGAVSWIVSGGDKAHVESAKARITNALIGLVLMICVFAIVGLVETFFDINILSIDIGPLVIQ